jgi:phosphopantetheinyl transferase
MCNFAATNLPVMPLLLLSHPLPGASFGLWQITEAESFFREGLPLSPGEERELAPLKDIRRQEWLAVRWLLHQVTGHKIRLPLAKDAFSKPFFPGHEHLTCSLSHSHGIVGALLGGTGCDIQVILEKTLRLAPKFLNATEQRFVDAQPAAYLSDLIHIFWTAKESLYKAYGLKALDFRAHMHLEPFDWDGQKGNANGKVEKGEFSQTYRLQFEKIRLEDGRELIWTVCGTVDGGR